MVLVDRFATASRRGMCVDTGTTRSSGQASIITGGSRLPVSRPRYSVWPGASNPPSYRVRLCTGLVTTADADPCLAYSTAWRMVARTTWVLAGSGWPGSTAAAKTAGTTGSASSNRAAGPAMDCTGTPSPMASDWAARRAGSSRTKNGGSPNALRLRQVFSRTSAPIPAGSPMVTAIGARAAGLAIIECR